MTNSSTNIKPTFVNVYLCLHSSTYINTCINRIHGIIITKTRTGKAAYNCIDKRTLPVPLRVCRCVYYVEAGAP